MAAIQTKVDVLVVEDDAAVRDAVKSILEAHGYAIACAANGREALNYLRTQRPARVILLDLMMPVMNGWEFRREQKGDPGLAGIPVVVYSGVDDAQAEADLIGAEGHLQKPVIGEELIETVARFVAAAPAAAEPVTAEAIAEPAPRFRFGEPRPR